MDKAAQMQRALEQCRDCFPLPEGDKGEFPTPHHEVAYRILNNRKEIYRVAHKLPRDLCFYLIMNFCTPGLERWVRAQWSSNELARREY